MCKVIKHGIVPEDISVSSMHLDILYFPEESNPECYPQEPPEVMEGEYITLKCSSASGNPKISMKWVNDDNVISNSQTEIDGRQVSFLKVLPKNNAVYLCKITSSAFPSKEASCHVGPVRVIRNPSVSLSTGADEHIPNITQLVPTFKPPVVTKEDTTLTILPVNEQGCHKQCRLLNSSSFYWIITAIVTSLFALIFLIICIILLCHHQSEKTHKRGRCVSTRPHLQDIYSELDIKSCNNKEYISDNIP